MFPIELDTDGKIPPPNSVQITMTFLTGLGGRDLFIDTANGCCIEIEAGLYPSELELVHHIVRLLRERKDRYPAARRMAVSE